MAPTAFSRRQRDPNRGWSVTAIQVYRGACSLPLPSPNVSSWRARCYVSSPMRGRNWPTHIFRASCTHRSSRLPTAPAWAVGGAYVDEVLRIHDETAHGPAFARVCREHGIDATAAGLPARDRGPGGGPDPMLRRIMRLLALADSPNLHEAEAAMNEARRLMLVHNIDAAATAATDGYGFRHVGRVKARSDASERILAGILGRHFFVSVIWVPSYLALQARTGQVLELCGRPAQPRRRRACARVPAATLSAHQEPELAGVAATAGLRARQDGGQAGRATSAGRRRPRSDSCASTDATLSFYHYVPPSLA